MSTLPIPGTDETERAKVTIRTLQAKHDRGEAITMLTAYDFPTARIVDQAGIDSILVGDSLAMVVLGYENTLAVTMDEMLHHAKAVRRGVKAALLIGDMPFMSYQAAVSDAVRNAGRFVQEAGMEAVKLEGGRAVVPAVEAIVRAGIPVLGHLGLMPQSVNALGGWRVQGRTAEAAALLLDEALALQDAGCFGVVLESVPDRLATYVTEQLTIPTIGIGAGAGTSGQVLVLHDMAGLFDRFTPKFVRRYANLSAELSAAVAAYRADVVAGGFPAAEHTYRMAEDEWRAFVARAAEVRNERVLADNQGGRGRA
jgi:3-methyl-2-oxobutanoate hydroxymethyltransferase